MKEMKKNMSKDRVFVQGNTVRQTQVAPKRERQQSVEEERRYRYHLAIETERQHQFSLGYKLGFVAVVGLSLCVLGGYIQEEATLYKQSRQIQLLQKQRDNLNLTNNVAEIRMEDNIDLGEIEKIAMEKYNMVYPSESQVIVYEKTEGDYIRQNENIPD